MTRKLQTCPKCSRLFEPRGEAMNPAVCPACGSSSPALPAGAQEESYFLARGKMKLGPFSLSQFRAMAAMGQLVPEDMILPVNSRQWVQAGSRPHIFSTANRANDPAVPVAPPAPPAAPSAEEEPVRPRWWRRAAITAISLAVLVFVAVAAWLRWPEGESGPGTDARGPSPAPPSLVDSVPGEDGAFSDTGSQEPAFGPPPEPKDAIDFCDRGVAFMRRGDFDRAIADFTEAIHQQDQFAEAYTLRGYAHERKGDRDRAAADFEVGRDLTRRLDDANFKAGSLFHDDVTERERRPEGPAEQVAEKDLGAWLRDLCKSQHCLAVTASALPSQDDHSVTVAVTTYGPGRDRLEEPRRRRWTCQVRSHEQWAQAVECLAYHAEFLTSADDRPLAPAPPRGHLALQMFYRFPVHRCVRIGKNDHLFFSREAQAHLGIARRSYDEAARHVLICNEPHNFPESQWALFRGLEVLVGDNPFIVQEKRTAFLVEGWPTGKPVPVKPLVDAVPQPNNGLIRDVLDTFLIPGHIASEWKHRWQIPIVGNEDPELYRISARLMSAGGLLDDLRSRVWLQAVGARNRAMARTLLEQTQRHDAGILFLGGRHLTGLEKREEVTDAEWQTVSPNLLSAAERDLVRNAEKKGVVDYLKEQGVGYTFLNPKGLPLVVGINFDEGANRRYGALFQAQTAPDPAEALSRYLQTHARPLDRTTVRPDPEWAARAALILQKRRGDGRRWGPRAQFRRRLIAIKLFPSPYVNHNARATESEKESGAWLNELANRWALRGVCRVEGLKEVEGESSPDYLFVHHDGTATHADLWEPETDNPDSFLTNIQKKSRQVGKKGTVVIRLGKGKSGLITIAKIREKIDSFYRAEEYRDVVGRVIVIQDMRIILDVFRPAPG